MPEQSVPPSSSDASGTRIWTSRSWRATAAAWLDERLAEAGVTRTGPVEQPHVRPWATALTAPTDAGRVWMKAVAPAMAVGLRIYPLLRAAAPASVLEPIAIRAERGWILLPDGGPVLGRALAGSERWTPWSGR